MQSFIPDANAEFYSRCKCRVLFPMQMQSFIPDDNEEELYNVQ